MNFNMRPNFIGIVLSILYGADGCGKFYGLARASFIVEDTALVVSSLNMRLTIDTKMFLKYLIS